MTTAAPPRRLVLQWHITERCNLRCAHCYQGEQPVFELPFHALRAILDQYDRLLARLRREGPVQGHVTVTGGEPFVRRDCLRLLREIRRRGHSLAVLTNGTLLDDVLARQLRQLEPAFVQVSIDGAQETHDALRGAGNLERVRAALRSLRRRRIRTLVSFSAHRGNLHELEQVVRLAVRYKVQRVWADRVIPWGRGGAMADQVLSPAETRAFFEQLEAARRWARGRWMSRTTVAMHRSLQFLVRGGPPYRCNAGRGLLAVLPDGVLLPCRRLPLRVGHLAERSLEALYHESPLLCALRRHRVSEGCDRCPHAAACRGGLRCLAHAVKGDAFAADPGCWLAGLS